MNVNSLAAAFIGEYGEHGNISNLKLNKLLYLTYAIELRKNNKLFPKSPFEAWEYGPVAPAVYAEYKKYRNESIGSPHHPYGEEEIQICRNAWERFGNLTAFDLVEITHRDDGAWQRVRSENRKIIEDVDIFASNDGNLNCLDFENTLGCISNDVDHNLSNVYKWLENR